MALFEEDELKRQIKNRDFQRVYFIHGNENFLKQHYANLIADKTVDKDFKDFNLHRLEGKDTTLNELADCVSTFPMMGEYTCTVVKDFPFTQYFGDRGKVNEDFNSIISDLPETTVLVFWCDTVEVDEKNSKWNKIIKYFDEYGVSARLNKRSVSALTKLLIDSATKKDCEISRDDALYMINLVGDDMSTLRNEFDKVCAFTGFGKITREHIDKTVIVSVEAKIFSLSRDIVNGEADKAYETLSNLFKLREEPVVILGVLSKAYVDMYRACAIKEKGLKPQELSNDFPSAYKGREFIITNASRDGARYSLTQFHTALNALSEADRRIKQTNQNDKQILEELILRLLRI